MTLKREESVYKFTVKMSCLTVFKYKDLYHGQTLHPPLNVVSSIETKLMPHSLLCNI